MAVMVAKVETGVAMVEYVVVMMEVVVVTAGHPPFLPPNHLVAGDHHAGIAGCYLLYPLSRAPGGPVPGGSGIHFPFYNWCIFYLL